MKPEQFDELCDSIKEAGVIKLLALSDAELLANPRVVAAYWGLKGVMRTDHDWHLVCGDCSLYRCYKCKKMAKSREESDCDCFKPIPGCIEKVAWEMRDACDFAIWSKILYTMTKKPWGNQSRALALGAKHWIVAAILCYNSSLDKPEKNRSEAMTCQHKNKKANGYSYKYGEEVSTMYYCYDCGRTFWLSVDEECTIRKGLENE